MSKELKVRDKYRHYKNGHEYEIIGLAKNTETLEDVVVYKALYKSEEFENNAIWVRPKEMFLGNVVVDGKEVERFQKIEQEILIKPSK